MALEKELETYKKRVGDLHDREGKYVVIQDEEILDFFDSYQDALKAGYAKFGSDTPFLVKRISLVERVQRFTRDIRAQCHP